MEISLRDGLSLIAVVGGWFAFFFTTRQQSVSNEKSIHSIEKQLEIKESKIIELQKHSTKLLHSDEADRKYVSKAELNLMLKHIDHKLDTVIDNQKKRERI